MALTSLPGVDIIETVLLCEVVVPPRYEAREVRGQTSDFWHLIQMREK